VGFSDTFCGKAFGSNVLAYTQNWTNGSVITESNIIFNDKYEWNVYDEPHIVGRWSGIRDFRRVALHELGHSMGLDHEDDVPAIMASAVTWGGGPSSGQLPMT